MPSRPRAAGAAGPCPTTTCRAWPRAGAAARPKTPGATGSGGAVEMSGLRPGGASGGAADGAPSAGAAAPAGATMLSGSAEFCAWAESGAGSPRAATQTIVRRSDIWAAAFEWFGNDTARLLTGYGYQSFWTSHAAEFVSMRVRFHISEGHSAYLDTLFTLGVIGLACYVVTLLTSLLLWTRAAYQRSNASFAVLAALLVFALIHGVAESTFVDPNLATFFTFCAMMMCAIYNPLRRSHGEEME